MKKHLLVVNPAAGQKSCLDAVRREAARVFDGLGEDYEIAVTRGRMDAARLVREAADSCPGGEELLVYACGGDGTLNECAGAAAGLPHVAVTQYPCGTGNDFLRCFGAESARFRELRELANGEVRPLDIILCDDGRCSLNICSVGLDARIGGDVHKYSDLPLIGGAMGYVVSTAVHFFRGIHSPMRIAAGELCFEGETTIVCACNGQFYGGGFHPVPEARPDDGLLEVLVVPAVSRLTFARVIVPYARGQFRRFPQYIRHTQARELSVRADEPFVVNLDGETLRRRSLRLRLAPGGLRFVVPRDMAFFHPQTQKTEISQK